MTVPAAHLILLDLIILILGEDYKS